MQAQRFQRSGYLMLKRRHAVIADPDFEKVTEDIECLGFDCASLEETKKRPGKLRAFFFEMQI
jgi:hypothetical protein